LLFIVLKEEPTMNYTSSSNKAIKDHPQIAVGWTRKETRALYV